LINGTITKEKPNQKLIDLMKAMRGYLEESSMMAYLSMMAPRLLEMRRVLKIQEVFICTAIPLLVII